MSISNEQPNYHLHYMYTAFGAILGAMGITVDVYAGDEPRKVIITICGLPPNVNRDLIVKALNRPEIKPLTDLVVVNFYPE